MDLGKDGKKKCASLQCEVILVTLHAGLLRCADARTGAFPATVVRKLTTAPTNYLRQATYLFSGKADQDILVGLLF